ncbi:MAG: DUF2589 domain-containing protein [Chitinophagaceae bacterium]
MATTTKTAKRPQNKSTSNHRINNLPSNLEHTINSIARSKDGMSRDEAIKAITNTATALAALGPLGAPSTNLTSELNNIDFKKMIGGPLQAAVDAQVASSIATVNFINQVGFAEDSNGKKELVMVDFTHTRKDVDAAGNPITKEVAVKVPLLAMLPIPSLRIEHVIIDFNVKLNSVETSAVSDKLGINAEVKGGWGPVSFKVSASYQRQTSTGVEVKKEYALNVNVKAVQDEIPSGLEKILGILAA